MSPPPPADAVAVTPRLLREWPLPAPPEGGTKHARGTVLVIGGARSTPGAALLAGLAALRAGAGRLQLATVEATAAAVGVAVPEARVDGYAMAPNGTLHASAAAAILDQLRKATVVLGPGLLGKEETAELLAALLPGLPEGPLVLDAVALSALGTNPDLLGGRKGVVLTPNSGEMAALLDDDEAEGCDAAGEIARRYDAVVTTQGWTAAPDGRLWSDEAGGAGLGTSGSGDVLSGIVGGLLALGAEPAQAAVWAQYVHAAAGDRLAATHGRIGYLARELLDEVPRVLSSLRD